MEGYDQFSFGFLVSFKKENINFTILYSVLQNYHILFLYNMFIINFLKYKDEAKSLCKHFLSK